MGQGILGLKLRNTCLLVYEGAESGESRFVGDGDKNKGSPDTAVQVRSTRAGSFVIPWIDGGLLIISVLSVWL